MKIKVRCDIMDNDKEIHHERTMIFYGKYNTTRDAKARN